MICFVIYGVNNKNLCPLIIINKRKHNFWNMYEYDILMILVDFCGIFATRIQLTKIKRFQTDPDPKHWF